MTEEIKKAKGGTGQAATKTVAAKSVTTAKASATKSASANSAASNKSKAAVEKIEKNSTAIAQSQATASDNLKQDVKKADTLQPAASAKKVEKKIDANGEKTFEKRILFVASESLPYVKTGGLADVATALPKALNNIGCDCRVIIPLYQTIANEFKQTMQFLGNCYVSLAWRYQYCGVFKQVYQGVTYYFIDNEYYFKRYGLYGHFDDAERFAFFSKAVLEAIQIIDFTPEIIHCNDWHTALIPVYLDTYYRKTGDCKNAKTVFTIHNIEFQGKYGTGIITDVLGLPLDKKSVVEYDDCVNFMKGGIECANAVTTVSPTYSNEILNSFYGYGMENILAKRKFKLTGIINGIDQSFNDPSTDKALFKNYSITSIDDKKENKKRMQEMLDLPHREEVPLIGMVGRLTHQKGFDLLVKCVEKILSMDIQMVILGTGDWQYESFLKDLQTRYAGKLRCIINFSSDMASKIYAASDMFLMPSKFEPCGLSQMISMRYGSIPIVRETGGLKDTVEPFVVEELKGTGFTFFEYNEKELLRAVERAIDLYYNNKLAWRRVVLNAMSRDFGWDNIAKKYLELYKKI